MLNKEITKLRVTEKSNKVSQKRIKLQEKAESDLSFV